MKKIVVILAVMLTLVGSAFATPGISEITEALKAATEVYKAIPNAEYIVTWYDYNNCADYGKVSSYAEAKAWVNILLRNGAVKVHVESVYGQTNEWFPPETAPNEAYLPNVIW